jgi:hypothetical protein
VQKSLDPWRKCRSATDHQFTPHSIYYALQLILRTSARRSKTGQLAILGTAIDINRPAVLCSLSIVENETGSSQEAEYSGYSECDVHLGCCSLPLVFLAVLSRHLARSQQIPMENMALMHAAFLFVSVCAFSLAAASPGSLILKVLKLEMNADGEHLLICTGVGVISIEMLLFCVEVTQQIPSIRSLAVVIASFVEAPR